MIADRSLEDEAKYFPLCENCKNQTSSECASNICSSGKKRKTHSSGASNTKKANGNGKV